MTSGFVFVWFFFLLLYFYPVELKLLEVLVYLVNICNAAFRGLGMYSKDMDSWLITILAEISRREIFHIL